MRISKVLLALILCGILAISMFGCAGLNYVGDEIEKEKNEETEIKDDTPKEPEKPQTNPALDTKLTKDEKDRLSSLLAYSSSLTDFGKLKAGDTYDFTKCGNENCEEFLRDVYLYDKITSGAKKELEASGKETTEGLVLKKDKVYEIMQFTIGCAYSGPTDAFKNYDGQVLLPYKGDKRFKEASIDKVYVMDNTLKIDFTLTVHDADIIVSTETFTADVTRMSENDIFLFRLNKIKRL